MKFVLLLTVVVTLVACTVGYQYEWGTIGPKDYKIESHKVSKLFFLGLRVSKTYIFKQKKIDALTITAIRVTDLKDKGAVAELVNGGPGSKGATLKFTSERSKGILSKVEIWGR
ncbi:uncharacterized protein LOC129907908 [Episyrphus balteatus]|uniref:uncharacterized protein LOC129907908 n=1 Tax=Episyrphus balteatus TaxID=286459 RepID=UPI002484EEA5|nr:uncharacterized protein LOC129907908 [Episyrphus balteatus]XP_055840376.1 uncharacterized protein LOC129907908 [Episyrphus balteatus]